MNRTQRRAFVRTAKTRVTREHFTEEKSSHKLVPQTCALWVSDARGYLADFSPSGFRVVEYAELARHYNENEAASAAITFREITGLRVAVRPVYCLHLTH